MAEIRAQHDTPALSGNLPQGGSKTRPYTGCPLNRSVAEIRALYARHRTGCVIPLLRGVSALADGVCYSHITLS